LNLTRANDGAVARGFSVVAPWRDSRSEQHLDPEREPGLIDNSSSHDLTLPL
jgi:hypothetical protein